LSSSGFSRKAVAVVKNDDAHQAELTAAVSNVREVEE